MMNPEIKERWIAALRSGEYKQTIGNLRVKDKFCCLGVLCDLAAKDGIGEWQENKNSNRFFSTPLFAASKLLPSTIVSWAGLNSPRVLIDDSSLVSLNDQGASFSEIADIIEKYL